MIARLAIAGLRAAAAARSRASVLPEDTFSVALIELTGLGDVISMLPAIQGFRTLFPAAQVHLIVENDFVELLRSFELPAAIHGVVRSRSTAGTARAVRLVRNLRATLACSMSPPRRNALVALASGAPCIAGYLRYTDSLAPYLVTTPVEGLGIECADGMQYGRNHISERALMICRALGLRNDPPWMPLEIAPAVADRVRSGLLRAGVVPPGEYVVLHPLAGWSYRQWPESAFADLARRFLDTQGTTVVFHWEGKAGGDLRMLRRRFNGDHRVVFASALGLLESAVLLSGASLFVGNDSGPLHLAAALQVPAVGLFGPSDPLLTAPRAQTGGSWLYKGVDCSPCDQRRCVRPENPCMSTIPADEAFAASVAVQRRRVHA